MNTLLLDDDVWDILVDASGNIAMASDPYSEAQDVASAIRTFQGECYYNVTVGVPYWTQILGQAIPISLLKAHFVNAALTVPFVAKAVCYISSFINRKVAGQVQIITTAGQTSVAAF